MTFRSDWRENLRQYRFPALSSQVQAKAAEVAASRETGNPLRLSASGYCARRLAYQKVNHATPTGIPKPFEAETLNPRALMVFHLGHLVESSLKTWIRDAGSLFMPLKPPEDRVSVKVFDREIPGHPDGLYQEQDGSISIVSIKSINSRGFERQENEGPPYEHVCQETAYMAALGIFKARFLYYNKNTSHLADDWVIEFDPVLYARIVQRWASVIESTEHALPPPEYRPEPETEWVRGLKGYKQGTVDGSVTLDSEGMTVTEVKSNGYYRQTGRKILPWQCSYCPFKKPCYGETLKPIELDDDKPVWVVDSYKIDSTYDRLRDLGVQPSATTKASATGAVASQEPGRSSNDGGVRT